MWFDLLRICKNRKKTPQFIRILSLRKSCFFKHILKSPGKCDPQHMTLTFPWVPMRHTKFQGNLSKYVDFRALKVSTFKQK